MGGGTLPVYDTRDTECKVPTYFTYSPVKQTIQTDRILNSSISKEKRTHLHQDMHPATAKWYDRRESVYIEFCVADSKDVKINFEKAKFGFSCLGGTDQVKHENEVDLFEAIDQNKSMHKRTDRSVLCCLRKADPGKAWPRLTKEKAKLSWLSVDFNNWKDWEDDSDEELGNFDRFSEVGGGDMAFNTQEAMAKMMNNMGGEDDLPDLDGADEDESADSDDEKMPDLE
ncbi:hypothetical protein UPYG_G00013380 [Umbra pygmaea]|uniref:Prostaglandin E synthase 3 n=1 Tax=Umbra pygmaea TaxID=75934 RepID=A0ABD0XJ31_UMBPY